MLWSVVPLATETTITGFYATNRHLLIIGKWKLKMETLGRQNIYVVQSFAVLRVAVSSLAGAHLG